MSEKWREYMATTIQHFNSALTAENQKQLDYSLASLDFVEQWLRDRYPLVDHLIFEKNQQIILGATFYVGETYRRNLKGWWKVDMSQFDPNDLNSYTAAQVIPEFDEPDADGDYEYSVTPMEDVIATIHKRPDLFFREVLNLMLKDSHS